MYNLTINPSEIKLQLFRFIDSLPDSKLQQFYNLLISNQENEQTDYWELLSDWEKDDIITGISDLESGKYRHINEVLAKY